MTTYANSNYNYGKVLHWISNQPRQINPADPHPHPAIHQAVGALQSNPLFAKQFLQAQSNDNKKDEGIASSNKQKWKHGFFPSSEVAAEYISKVFTDPATRNLVRAKLLNLDNNTSNREIFRVEWNVAPINIIVTERAGGQHNATAPGAANVTSVPMKGIFVYLKTSAENDYPILQTCFPFDAAEIPNNATLIHTF